MSYWTGKRVLITGGAGFIGSHVTDALLTHGAARVVVVDNFFLGSEANLASARRVHGEACVIHREDAGEWTALKSVFDREKPDIVLNLATKALVYSFVNPAGACRVNLDIALNLGELLRSEAYSRLIHLSSSEVYGSARSVPMDELHPLLAETSYAAGKAAADLLLGSYVNMFGLNVLTVRPFNNYGPRQNAVGALAGIIPATIRRIRQGARPRIQGDGLQTRDFIYVGDTVSALLALAARDDLNGRVVNLGSGRETAIRDLIGLICAQLGYRGDLEVLPARAADVRRHCADVAQARSLLGEVAPTSLEDGVRQTVSWYLDNEKIIDSSN